MDEEISSHNLRINAGLDCWPVFIRKETSSPVLDVLVAKLAKERTFWEQTRANTQDGHSGVVWHCTNERDAVEMMLAGAEKVPNLLWKHTTVML
jgi:hypothetical protein